MLNGLDLFSGIGGLSLALRRHGKHSPSVAVAERGHTGFLNSAFVEVMMGYFVGWTALEDWATQWFHSKRERLSNDSLASKEAAN